MAAGASVARNNATRATSVGVMSGLAPGSPRASIAVSTDPGQMAFTTMPSGRSSSAKARVRPTTPCLAAQYAPRSGVPRRPPNRRDVDDATATLTAQAGQKRLSHQEHTLQVGGQHIVPGFLGQRLDTCPRHDASVVHEDVGSAQAGQHQVAKTVTSSRCRTSQAATR